MQEEQGGLSRRSFLKTSTAAGAGASAFTIIRPELVRGAGNEKLKAGIIGVGGRGSGAIDNILTGCPNVELVAMADIFEDHLEQNLARLRKRPFADRIKVDAEHRFVGFDAYKKLVASDIDIVMLTTPPGYRPQHFEAAVEAKKHVFCEKPIATDPVGVRRFIKAAEKARQLKLTVMAGAQRHASTDYVETVDKIHNGAIGEIVALNSNYLSGPVMHAKARDPKWGDMEWEHRNWYSFIWICGDQIVEQHFHNIDFMNWVMGGAHPVKVVASGGACWRPREPLYGNIYDHMCSDFVYPNGVHLASNCRQYPNGLYRRVDDLIIGAKGRSTGNDMGAKGINPQVQEHIDMVNSILGKGPYINQGVRVAESTMTCIMARESAYSGLEITWDMIMNSQQDLQPKSFDYRLETKPAPLPVPGEYKFI